MSRRAKHLMRFGVLLLWFPMVCAAASPPAAEREAGVGSNALDAGALLGSAHLYNDPAGSAGHPAAMWADGVALGADLAAARNQPANYGQLVWAFIQSLDRYWDRDEQIPGYEPFPTNGRGHDKYYDDNAWIAIALLKGYDMGKRPEILGRAASGGVRRQRLGRADRRWNLVARAAQGRVKKHLRQRPRGGRVPAPGAVFSPQQAAELRHMARASSTGPAPISRIPMGCSPTTLKSAAKSATPS